MLCWGTSSCGVGGGFKGVDHGSEDKIKSPKLLRATEAGAAAADEEDADVDVNDTTGFDVVTE